MKNIFNYVDRPSPIHRLTGATKLVCLLSGCAGRRAFFCLLIPPILRPPAPGADDIRRCRTGGSGSPG